MNRILRILTFGHAGHSASVSLSTKSNVKVTPTQIANHAWNGFWVVVGILAVIPPHVVDIFPKDKRPYILGAVAAALWIKSHRNLFINPDGTPAQTSYDPK